MIKEVEEGNLRKSLICHFIAIISSFLLSFLLLEFLLYPLLVLLIASYMFSAERWTFSTSLK